MEAIMNTIGSWILNNIWISVRDATFHSSPLQIAIIFGIFLVAMDLSFFGIISRVSDFIFNIGIITGMAVFVSAPMSLILSATASIAVFSLLLIVFQCLLFIFICAIFMIAILSTFYALYKGEPHMNLIQMWSVN